MGITMPFRPGRHSAARWPAAARNGVMQPKLATSGSIRSGPFGGVVAALVLGGCVAGEGPQVVSPKAGLKCVDDSPACVAERQATLKSLLADPNRGWVKERPDAAAYASGVRLFAFKKQKKGLSCPELQAGRHEAEAAPAALRAPGSGLSPAQISRGVMLAGEIGRELTQEFQRRCRKS